MGADVVVNDTGDQLHARFRGATKELVALRLENEPDGASLVQAVDYDELAGPKPLALLRRSFPSSQVHRSSLS